MGSVYYKISKRKREDGRREVFVRIRVTRNGFVQMRTGVFVSESMWATREGPGAHEYGRVVVPKRGRLNTGDVLEAEKAVRELEDVSVRMQRLVSLMGAEFFRDKDTAMRVLRRTQNIGVADLTYKIVEDALGEVKAAASMPDGEGERTLWAMCRVFLAEEGISEARCRHYWVLMRDVYRWSEYRKAMRDEFVLDIDRLTSDDIVDFRQYESMERTLQEEQPSLFKRIMESYPDGIKSQTGGVRSEVCDRGANTVVGKVKKLKVLYNWMLRRRFTKNNPFLGMTIGTEVYGTPYYLTVEERNRLADAEFPGRPMLEVQRDIFVFQCLVGCRVSDLYKLTEANISNGVLEYVPRKTKDEQAQVKPRVPLSERALALIGKYRGKDEKGRLFPFISTDKYNHAIKDMVRLAGIERCVMVRNSLTGENEARPIWEVASSHMARRTFIGAAYSKVQDPNVIGRMSGHVEGSRAFARYRTITDDVLKNVIDLME